MYLLSDKPEVRQKTADILMSYWNTLDPVPQRSHYGVPDTMLYDPEQQKWGSETALARPVREIGGFTLATYHDRHRHPVWLFQQNGQTRFSLTVESGKNGGTHVTGQTTRVDPGPGEPLADAVATFLNGLDPVPNANGSERIAALGLWKRPGQPWMRFDGARLGMQPVADGWADLGRGEVDLYDSHGGFVAGFNSYNRQFKSPSSRAFVRAHADEVAKLLNQVRLEAPSGNNDRSDLKDLNLIHSKGQWQALTGGKDLFAEDGFALKAATPTQLTMSGPSGEIALQIRKKGREFKVEVARAAKDVAKALTLFGRWAKAQQGTVDWPELQDYGMMEADDGEVKPIREVYPPREIRSYEDGDVWTTCAWTRLDGKFGYGYPVPASYLLRNGTAGRARVFAFDKKVSRIIVNTENKMVEADTDNVVPYIGKLEDLIAAEGVIVPPKMLNDLGLMLVQGKLKPVSDNPRLEQFANGRITYEDGHVWEKDDYHGTRWALSNADNRSLMRVELDGEGYVAEIKFSHRDVRKKPKDYKPYLEDFMDIVAIMVGGDED